MVRQLPRGQRFLSGVYFRFGRTNWRRKGKVLITPIQSIFLGIKGFNITLHLLLNNRIRAIEIENLTSQELNEKRLKFEIKWNFFNIIPLGTSFFVNLILLMLLST